VARIDAGELPGESGHQFALEKELGDSGSKACRAFRAQFLNDKGWRHQP